MWTDRKKSEKKQNEAVPGRSHLYNLHTSMIYSSRRAHWYRSHDPTPAHTIYRLHMCMACRREWSAKPPLALRRASDAPRMRRPPLWDWPPHPGPASLAHRRTGARAPAHAWYGGAPGGQWQGNGGGGGGGDGGDGGGGGGDGDGGDGGTMENGGGGEGGRGGVMAAAAGWRRWWQQWRRR